MTSTRATTKLLADGGDPDCSYQDTLPTLFNPSVGFWLIRIVALTLAQLSRPSPQQFRKKEHCCRELLGEGLAAL